MKVAAEFEACFAAPLDGYRYLVVGAHFWFWSSRHKLLPAHDNMASKPSGMARFTH